MILYRKVQAYLKATGMRPARFGRLVAADPRLVFDMRKGRQPRLPLARKIEAFIGRGAPTGGDA